jgi:hypothetical protein
MHTKLITACMALVAFAALAIGPATASATNDPLLTQNTVAVAKGTKIVGTNVGNTVFTDTSTNALVTCTKALMTGEVIENQEGIVEGTISTSDFWAGGGSESKHNNTEECDGSFGDAYITVVGHLCVRSTPAMTTDEFQVTRGKCGEGLNPRFIIGSTTVGACEYETTGPVKGDAATHPNSGLTVRNTQAGSGAKKIAGGFFCPGSGMLKMTFALETEDGTAILVS